MNNPESLGKSHFCPPRMIAREEPYCLFLDELNVCSHEVQKAFYSLILDKRVGEYSMPKGSIVIGAGNHAEDSAFVKPMPSALINRMFHINLRASHPWHILSDALKSYGEDISDEIIGILAYGSISPIHAGQFKAFVKQIRNKYALNDIVKGDARWPDKPEDRDILYFLAQSLRDLTS